jgi:hypothetical protein
MGMGLSISRSIIEAHDGRLWSAPNAPRGSVFHFVLPADTRHGGRPAGGVATFYTDWDGALAHERNGTGWEPTPWHATQRGREWQRLLKADVGGEE